MNPFETLIAGPGRKRHVWLVAASLVAMSPAIAHAQADAAAADGPQASEDNSADEGEIIVTGSRAAVNGFQAPSAVSVLGGDLIERQSPTNVAEVLQQEPAFKASRSPGGNANNFSSPGQSTADLRGLGGQRTLVLVNGSRVVPQAPAVTTGVPVTTDLNVIPTNMIDRVEVVTGGASAQYGSDAVAGVVNILLKKKFTGLELTAQTGISQQGDNFRYKFGGVGGIAFDEGRGNLVVAVEATSMDGIKDIYSRDWGRDEYMIVTNAGFATNGLPANIVAKYVRNNLAAGGKIIGPANFSLNGRTFNADGTTRPFDSGSLNNGTYQIGGEGKSRNAGSSLIPGLERFVAYAHLQYEVSDALTLILEGGYSKTKGFFTGGLPNINPLTIRNDNAYLSQSVKDAMAAQSLTSFQFAKGFYDMGNINFTVTNETPHITVGIEGSLGGDWHYDAHYSFGENRFLSSFTNNFSPALYALASDAVVNPANGQIVCRSTLPNATPNPLAAGCAPLNVFGPTSSTAAAQAYVNRSGYNAVYYRQHAGGVNVRGEPFSTWAGPVSVAFGGEFRKEYENLTADPFSTAGRFAIGNATPFSGKFDVKEGYLEAIVPLARDISFIRSLDVNGAIRYADYSTAGGQTTWKLGGVWEPVDGLRFRVTRSRDIRAPAIYELFSPGSSTNTALTVKGVTAVIPQNRTVGNPNLKPEKADTFTLGVVLQPAGIPGLHASVDYYHIDLKDAIDSLSAANIGNACTAGDAQACSYITFSGATPTRLVAPIQNISQFKTSGLDMALSYRLGLGGGSSLTTRFSGTYALNAWINGIDRAGENGQGSLGAVPRFRGNLSETFSNDWLSLTAQLIYISEGTNDNQFNTIPALSINDNTIKAAAYVNLYSTIKVADRFEIGWSIDNLFDKDPPVSPYATQGQPVNGQYYDKIGRVYEVNVKVKF